MDTSPEYIKMCADLPPEFLPDRGYEEGDYCVFAKTKYMPWDHVGILGTRGFDHPSIWLPRLDQLLEIVRGDSLHIYILLRFNTFADARYRQDHGWGLKFPTLEQMALSFVMHTLHGMTWTGEAWEPERTDREKELQKIFEEEDGQ